MLNLCIFQNCWCNLRKLANLGIPFLVVPVNLKVINELTAGEFRLISLLNPVPMRKSFPFLNVFEVIDLVPQTWVKGNGPVIR
jgi:hypothetical protein